MLQIKLWLIKKTKPIIEMDHQKNQNQIIPKIYWTILIIKENHQMRKTR
jgi:hypothetical protein